jgi:hypothetical protein
VAPSGVGHKIYFSSPNADSRRTGYTESNPFADSQQRQHGSLSFPAVTEPVAPVAPTSNYYTTSPHYTVPAEYRDGNGRGVIQNGRSEVQYGRGGIQYGTGGTYGAGGRSRAVYPDRDSDTRQRQQPDEGYRQPVYPYRGNPEGQGYPRNRQMASQGDMSGT